MIKNAIVLIFLVGTVAALNIYLNMKNRKNIDKLNQLEQVVDSLENEVFIHSTNVTRYEIALDRLKEEDSVAASKFDKALSNIE